MVQFAAHGKRCVTKTIRRDACTALQDKRSVVFATLNAKYGWHLVAPMRTRNGKDTKANHERSGLHHQLSKLVEGDKNQFSKFLSKTTKRNSVFTHEGLVPEYECFNICSNAWGSYINGSLRSLIETGKGRPNRREKQEPKKISQ